MADDRDAELAALGRKYKRAKEGVERVKDEVRGVVLAALADGYSETKLSKLCEVDRMTIRAWRKAENAG